MSPSLRKATLLVGVSIAAVVGFGDIGYAISLGMSEIARNHELDEGAKNHGAVVSEAARHHGGGASVEHFSGSPALLNSQSTTPTIPAVGGLPSAEHYSGGIALLTQSTLDPPQSIPEPGTLLLLGAGLLGLAFLGSSTLYSFFGPAQAVDLPMS